MLSKYFIQTFFSSQYHSDIISGLIFCIEDNKFNLWKWSPVSTSDSLCMDFVFSGSLS